MKNKPPTIRKVYNKAFIPEFYENHELYFSDPSELHKTISFFHVVKPRTFLLKWSNHSFYDAFKEYEITQVSVPWQILHGKFKFNQNLGCYKFYDINFLAFSHTNILDVPNITELAVRENHLFPAYLPNLSTAGRPCYGSASEGLTRVSDQTIYFDDRNKKKRFVPNFKDNLFELTLYLFDSFFEGHSNPDYYCYIAQENESVDTYIVDINRVNHYTHWFDPNWTEEMVTSQEFLRELKKRRFKEANNYWDTEVLKNSVWSLGL